MIENPDFALLRALSALEKRLQGLVNPVLAYSGGLDSRFVAHVAARGELAPVLLHVTGPHIPRVENVWASLWACRNGFTLRCVEMDPLELPEVAAGRPDRCYFCKRALFERLGEVLEPGAPYALCDGTNASDAFRPGLRALAELGVISPLSEVGLRKEDIRILAQVTALERPQQHARPCLLTRLPYGMRPTREILARIAAMESVTDHALRLLLRCNAEPPDFRVRARENGSFAVHVALAGEIVDSDAWRGLNAGVNRALREAGLPAASVIFMDRVSGYFDRCAHSVRA